MTAFVRAFLQCDSCHEHWDTATVPSARTITEAREEARRAGWTRRKGRDLCPYCASEEEPPR
ncbi:hypothetical protein [Actinacidiphila acididurans]|uniref:Small CPxCG-related zinc finger protein n=1 Tax=Actinacidiphila acididurans TaxID=2784346 RepID=A0ABS2U4Y2_9ACTN|nr:hypothetical protein [Actinacidiphila acididurans]MBM9510052.1 hypothetical protein [Actinacidiphila acididurans]